MDAPKVPSTTFQWLGFAAMILVGCSGAGNELSTTSGSGGDTSGTGEMTSGTGSSGSSAGGSGGSLGGSGGSVGGSGGTAEDAGVDVAAPVDSAGGTEARRDVVSADSSAKSRQTARPIGMPYAKNGFWEYLPPNYGDGVKRPLLLFMHGSGENGTGSATELNKVLRHGPAKLINTNVWTADRPFIVLSMQHNASNGICPSATEVHDFLTFAIASYDVDPTRVYITGLSCGGHGGFAYLGQYRGEQAVAAVLIAANSSPAYQAAGCALLSQVGLWSIHGEDDGPAQDTAGMEKFMACPQPRKDAKYTLFPGANHQETWEMAYDNPTFMNDIVSWFLGQSK